VVELNRSGLAHRRRAGFLPRLAGAHFVTSRSGDRRADRPPVDIDQEFWDKFAVSTSELIEKEVSTLPESLQREVYDFARFLHLQNSDDSFDGLRLSETALARDWNTPEEDAAWASL
jgi:hypothetical protein